jgi:hypothetical protein
VQGGKVENEAMKCFNFERIIKAPDFVKEVLKNQTLEEYDIGQISTFNR